MQTSPAAEPDRLPAGSAERTNPVDPAHSQVREPWRFWIVAGIFSLLIGLVLVRLISYQLFPQKQEDQGTLLEPRQPRGSIVDRDGNLLAFDRYFVDITATAMYLDQEDRVEVARILASLAGLDPNQVISTLTANADRPYALLAKGVPLDVGQKVLNFKEAEEEESIFGPMQYVNVDVAPERYYPQENLAVHLLGIVGVDRIDETKRRGYYGTEGYYDSYLWRNGVGLPVRTNDRLESLSPETRRYLPSVAGRDLVLTIDRTIQWICEDELRQAIERYGAEAGTAIVMEPDTGAILALANYPSYDPNRYAQENPKYYGNPAVSAQYEPGSIFKIITFGAALDAGLVVPSTPFTDTGSITLGQRIFFNSDRTAVGRTDASDALARSLNVVSVQVASLVGTELFYQYLQRFGFGSPTEVDLSGEVPGSIKLPGTLNWSLSDLGTNSFGQGLAVTPMQMVNAAAAIANDGVLMRPYVVQARVYNDEVLQTEPTVVRTTISPEAAHELTEMMVHVVERGTPLAGVRGYRVAGKTGTAQIPTEEGYTDDETIVSFVGFAPAEEPRFVLLVKMDRPDPNISPWATYTAAPTFSRIAKRLLEHMNIPPDDIRLAGTGS